MVQRYKKILKSGVSEGVMYSVSAILFLAQRSDYWVRLWA
jgi:hypothetical protein